jgi:hypothetical protein
MRKDLNIKVRPLKTEIESMFSFSKTVLEGYTLDHTAIESVRSNQNRSLADSEYLNY